jgi:Rieske Fe-S protein
MEHGRQDYGSRRSFLKKLNLLLSSLVAAIAVVPGIGYLLHPWLKDPISFQNKESRLGPVSQFKVGQPKKVTVSAGKKDAWQTTPEVTIGSVWVIRTQEKPPEFKVLSTVCPHLGCPVGQIKDGFHCPCHNSRFTARGERVEDSSKTNPSPRDMDTLAHRIEGGELICSFQKFRSGIAEQVALGS